MTFTLRWQFPESDQSPGNLLEVIAECVPRAETGVGVFSFASSHGVRILMKDPAFEAFLEETVGFELLVGVDAVTLPATLGLLGEFARSYPNLSVRAFFHERSILFHPKLCWFSDANRRSRVLIGSGNLTRGGLLKNWEAFSDNSLDAPATRGLTTSWNEWKQTHQGNIVGVDDLRAINRAARNEQRERDRKHEERIVEEADTVPSTARSPELVLLAEIPRASNRWNQANFDQATFRTYFQLGTENQRVILVPVSALGVAGEEEVRPGVAVRSRNYRIELGLAANRPYPARPPIAVFKRTGRRQFRYRLVMPGDADYNAIERLLAELGGARNPSRMRREQLPANEFHLRLPQFNL